MSVVIWHYIYFSSNVKIRLESIPGTNPYYAMSVKIFAQGNTF